MKLVCSLAAALVMAASVAAQPTSPALQAAKAEIRAVLDAPRKWGRPMASDFKVRIDGRTRSFESDEESHNRATLVFRAAWVLPPAKDSPHPRTSMAHLFAAAARGPGRESESVVRFIARAEHVRDDALRDLSALRAKVAGEPLRPLRVPLERAIAALEEMQRAGSTLNHDWGKTLGDLLSALR